MRLLTLVVNEVMIWEREGKKGKEIEGKEEGGEEGEEHRLSAPQFLVWPRNHTFFFTVHAGIEQ